MKVWKEIDTIPVGLENDTATEKASVQLRKTDTVHCDLPSPPKSHKTDSDLQSKKAIHISRWQIVGQASSGKGELHLETTNNLPSLKSAE